MKEFFAMGGYGYFIWMSYGVTALCMIGEVVLLIQGRQSLLQRLRRLVRARQADAAQGAGSEPGRE